MGLVFSKTIRIADRLIGEGNRTFIIAEAGVAHFGSLEKALRLVDLAVEAKADAVKFQIFKTDELISEVSTEWKDRLRSKELPYEAFRIIQGYCREKDIIFFATAHDLPSLMAIDELDVPVYKVGSGEVDNWPFLMEIASRKKPVILSTGMYSLTQIEQSLCVFEKVGNPDVALLHCVTEYPTPPTDVNLKAMETIRNTFKVIVGYSDHTAGFHFPIAAAALGARIIEKHISLDFNVPNAQDWIVSCGPDNLHLMVQQIREIEIGMGTGEKRPTHGEESSLLWARKSLVTLKDIKENETLSWANLGCKRPGTGIPPSQADKVIGKKVKTRIRKDIILQWEHLA